MFLGTSVEPDLVTAGPDLLPGLRRLVGKGGTHALQAVPQLQRDMPADATDRRWTGKTAYAASCAVSDCRKHRKALGFGSGPGLVTGASDDIRHRQPSSGPRRKRVPVSDLTWRTCYLRGNDGP